jgi:hypothetical protein
MTPDQQSKQQKRINAQINFNKMVLRKIHPHWEDYPIDDLRQIEAYKGEDSDEFEDFADEIQEAYWMLRNIEIMEGKYNAL